MIIKTPIFCQGANNVYRTKHYIVKQELRLNVGRGEENSMTSVDTFYLRNAERDKIYEAWFFDRARINGKRIMTASYTRQYID